MDYKDFLNDQPSINEVYAYAPDILSESYDRFDSIINKFGPRNGKYLLAIPGKQYRRDISNMLISNGVSDDQKRKIISLLMPGGSKPCPFFYPVKKNINYMDLNFINAALEAKNKDLLNYVVVSEDALDGCISFADNAFDPNEHITHEWLIESKVLANDGALEKILKILKPTVLMHSEIFYLDQNFELKKHYLEIWKKIILMANENTTFNIYTTNDKKNKYWDDINISDLQEEFQSVLVNGTKINIYIYEDNVTFHKRHFFGKHGGWKCDRGIHLSHKDTMFFDYTAIGPADNRNDFLKYEKLLAEYHLSCK